MMVVLKRNKSVKKKNKHRKMTANESKQTLNMMAQNRAHNMEHFHLDNVKQTVTVCEKDAKIAFKEMRKVFSVTHQCYIMPRCTYGKHNDAIDKLDPNNTEMHFNCDSRVEKFAKALFHNFQWLRQHTSKQQHTQKPKSAHTTYIYTLCEMALRSLRDHTYARFVTWEDFVQLPGMSPQLIEYVTSARTT